MRFYDLTKEERVALVDRIHKDIANDLAQGQTSNILTYFSDADTYIRKSGYLATGNIFYQDHTLRPKVIQRLKTLLSSEEAKVRQTVINAAGEIGKCHFDLVKDFFDIGLFDEHHSVRNAVIGSMKKMGQVNPQPILVWSEPYLTHSDKEVRREICHGLELRGRTHPQEILPLLQQLEFDETKRVSDTLIHVLGQISYKNGCLKTVVAHLKSWKNKGLVQKALDEIVDVHDRYKSFAVLSQQQAITYIDKHYN
ncbi:HEAT repeat domain-containing protein [Flavobacteriaceae bacterium S356]|uniref:HEAT repeat domain-containing protein n=1 Tax=Asprobacillus argus TaxID=3076534 RepID=A0ABU3LDX3_9FLAO|nr:HEAT repeat domain-containing protein [Flavobacteriaceae bacterium S356]